MICVVSGSVLDVLPNIVAKISKQLKVTVTLTLKGKKNMIRIFPEFAFVDDYKKNWLHVDCSATYKASASDKFSIGATGIGIRTIANFLQKLN